MRRAVQTWAPYCVNYLVIYISLSHSSGVVNTVFRFVSFRGLEFYIYSDKDTACLFELENDLFRARISYIVVVTAQEKTV